MRHAVDTLHQRRSISASLRQAVSSYGRRPAASGVYFQKQSDWGVRYRLSMRYQAGPKVASLLQVCDGQSHWKYTAVLAEEEPRLEKIDLALFHRMLEENLPGPELPTMDMIPGKGGLAATLLFIAENFDLTAIQPDELPGQNPIWRIEGRAAERFQLAGSDPEAVRWSKSRVPHRAGAAYPEPRPTRVVLSLGREDYFPYRIEYYVDASPGNASPGDPLLLTAIDLYDVRLDAPIDPTQFQYQPADIQPIDVTREAAAAVR